MKSRWKQTILAASFIAVLCCLEPSRSADDDPKSQTKQVGLSAVKIALRESSDSATFAVTGLSKLDWIQKLPIEELQNCIAVRVHQPGIATNPIPLLGTHAIVGKELQFTSRFPLRPALQYRVELAPFLLEGVMDAEPVVFSILPKQRTAASMVTAVYPSADVLPENLLKFYIHFSEPMSRGEAYKRIHLMHGESEVDTPFLELGEELWDTEQKRFTLFIHPGRIKRGLKPREDIGTPMLDGNLYRLQIDSEWLSADLQPLAKPFVKRFRVVAADAEQPDPDKWKVTAPKANTKQPVSLTFDEPLDQALLSRVVSVLDASPAAVRGQASMSLNETVWSFVPTEPWKPGIYRIKLESTMEDLAGNNLARRFETLEQETNLDEKAISEVSIEYVVRR